MPPIPPDPLHECLKVSGMSADGTTWFMEVHQLFTIEDMLLFHPSEAQDLMKIYNGQQTCQTNKLGMDLQNKEADFISWVNDLKQRQ